MPEVPHVYALSVHCLCILKLLLNERAQRWARIARIALLLHLTEASVGAQNVRTLQIWSIVFTMLECLAHTHAGKGLLDVSLSEALPPELPAGTCAPLMLRGAIRRCMAAAACQKLDGFFETCTQGFARVTTAPRGITKGHNLARHNENHNVWHPRLESWLELEQVGGHERTCGTSALASASYTFKPHLLRILS